MNSITVAINEQQLTILEFAIIHYSNKVRNQVKRGEVFSEELQTKLERIAEVTSLLESWSQHFEEIAIPDSNPLSGTPIIPPSIKPIEEWEK